MNATTGRGFHYIIDTELGIVHAAASHMMNRTCPGLQFAVKYKYAENFSVYTTRDAERLDERNLRSCHRCWETLASQAKKRDGKKPIPGFVKEPPK
jgi:hypothetical protein